MNDVVVNNESDMTMLMISSAVLYLSSGYLYWYVPYVQYQGLKYLYLCKTILDLLEYRSDQ
jgi:hypothetical protein